MPMMKQAVEHGADGGGITEQLTPVFDGANWRSATQASSFPKRQVPQLIFSSESLHC